MISAEEALTRLQDGNRRFIAGLEGEGKHSNHVRRKLIAGTQSPFAIILGCSDSRVPAEILFDQGIGDLFVIRVAGNIAAPSQIGSVEYAASNFATPLVVVLGHTQCGAILTTLEYLREPTAHEHSVSSRSIVEHIRPAVEKLIDEESPDSVWQAAVRANVNASVDQLRTGSRVVEQLIDAEKLRIVGAEYSLQTGAVEFL